MIKILKLYGKLILSVFLLFMSCQWGQTEKIVNDLKVGVFVSDMTPPLGYPVHKVTSDGVLDSLEIKTLVIEQNGYKGALVIADLFYIPFELSDMVRKLAAEKTGIPVSNICLAATHTHADPTCYEEIEEYISKINSNESIIKSEYVFAEQLIQKIVNSIVEAKTKLEPVVLKSGVAYVDGLSFNRRHLMKDGTVKMNGGFLNPDIVRSVGPIDPELGMILFEYKQNEKAFVSFSSFAMQLATIGNTTKYSSDFPHFFELGLQRHFGTDFMSIFGEGACADVNHWDITKPGPQIGYELITSSIGEKMASVLLEKISEFKRNDVTLMIGNRIVKVPLQTYSDMDLEWASSYNGTGSFLLNARAKKILSLQKLREKFGDVVPLETQAFAFSDETVIVALPGQIFVELGLELKKASPFKNTIILTLANSHEECIPIRKAFPEGSYEIIYSLVDSGGGEILIGEALSLLNEIRAKIKEI